MVQQPLNNRTAIVNADGTPTPYFIRLLQDRGISLDDKITLEQAITLLGDYEVVAGTGLGGGGPLNSDPELFLDAGLDDLNDVDLTTTPPTDGQALVYDASLEMWVPGAGGGGGGGGGGLFDISMGVPASPTQIGSGNIAWSQNGTLGLNVKYSGGGITTRIGGWIVPVPATPAWNVAVLALHNTANARYFGSSIGVHNNTTGRLNTMVPFEGAHSQGEFMSWNSATSRNSTSNFALSGGAHSGPLWLHVWFDGTTLFYGISKDGANPALVRSELPSAWIGIVDNIFIGSFFDSNIDVTGIGTSILCYDDNAASRVVGVSGGGGGGGSGTVTSVDVESNIPGIDATGGPITASGVIDLDLTNVNDFKTALGLGTAADKDATDFATAAQGILADSAVQPGDLATVAFTGDYDDLSNKPTIPTQGITHYRFPLFVGVPPEVLYGPDGEIIYMELSHG